MELKQLLTLFPGRYLYRIIQVSKYINSIHGLISKIIEYILEWNLVEKSLKVEGVYRGEGVRLFLLQLMKIFLFLPEKEHII